MNRKKRIQSIISKNFKEWELVIYDNSIDHSGHNNFDGTQESHFQIILKKKSSIKVSRIEVHKRINKLLKSEFLDGLHALEIKIIN